MTGGGDVSLIVEEEHGPKGNGLGKKSGQGFYYTYGKEERRVQRMISPETASLHSYPSLTIMILKLTEQQQQEMQDSRQ